MFSPRDLHDFRDLARQQLINQPANPRLEGFSDILNDDEQRALAYYEAALILLNRKQAIRCLEDHAPVFKTVK